MYITKELRMSGSNEEVYKNVKRRLVNKKKECNIMSKQKVLIFQTAIKNNKYSEFLTHYTVEELQTFDIHMFYGNTMGYAIKPDWEIANVFNNSLNVRHIGQALVVDAVRNGGKTIFCFDGYPARIWQKLGFLETKREKFNRDLAPENWEYSFYGCPDLLYLTFWPAMSEFKRITNKRRII